MRLPIALAAVAVTASMLSACGDPYAPGYAYNTDAYPYGYRYSSGYNYYPTGYYAPRYGYYQPGYYGPRYGYYGAPGYYYGSRAPRMTIAATF